MRTRLHLGDTTEGRDWRQGSRLGEAWLGTGDTCGGGTWLWMGRRWGQGWAGTAGAVDGMALLGLWMGWHWLWMVSHWGGTAAGGAIRCAGEKKGRCPF